MLNMTGVFYQQLNEAAKQAGSPRGVHEPLVEAVSSQSSVVALNSLVVALKLTSNLVMFS